MKRFRKIMVMIVTCLVVVTLALSGCGPEATEAPETEDAAPVEEAEEAEESEAEEEEEPAAEAGDLVFAVVPKIAHPFYDDVRSGLEEKAEELGVEFQWIAPPTGNPAEQVQILEDLINKGVDGIGLAPLEASSVAPVIAKATEAGIPVVTFDSDAPDSDRVAYFGTDNFAAGYEEGNVLAEAIGGEGKVALVTGSLVMENLNERIEGIEACFEENYPDIEVLDVVTTDDDFAKGLETCEAMLRAHPDLDGVANMSATGGPCLAQILADPTFEHFKDQLTIVGFDDFPEVLQAIRDGYVMATMVQRPRQMGVKVIESLYDLNTGGSASSVDTGITVVTMDNIDTYKGGKKETEAGELLFAVVPKIAHPFYDDVRVGLEEKAGELGVEFQWIAPPTGNPAEQVQILEDLINKGVDGIGLAPLEASSVAPVIAKATEAGIPVVTFDSDAPDSDRVAYFGTDNYAAGYEEGEVLAEAIGGEGKVALVTGSLVMENLNERIKGIEACFEENYPDIEVLDVVTTDDDFAKGLETCEAMLRAHPDLDGVANMSATGGPCLAQILADPTFEHFKDQLTIVGFDDFPEVLQAIRDGYVMATMVQRPRQMGVKVIESLYDLNTGGSASSVDTGITVVTMDNIDTYKGGKKETAD